MILNVRFNVLLLAVIYKTHVERRFLIVLRNQALPSNLNSTPKCIILYYLYQGCGSSRIFFASASSNSQMLPSLLPLPASFSSKCFRFHNNLISFTSLTCTSSLDLVSEAHPRNIASINIPVISGGEPFVILMYRIYSRPPPPGRARYAR